MSAPMPFLVWTDVNLDGSQSGSQVTLDSNVMQNPSRNPCWIDEVRFVFNSSDGATIPFVAARLQVNRQMITNEFVPLWSLSKEINTLCPVGNQSPFPNNQIQANQDVLVYRPPVPIYVPRGCYLKVDLTLFPPSFNYDSSDGREPPILHQPTRIYCAFACRDIDPNDPIPATVSVPWVAKWLPPPFPGQTRTRVQSTQSDLIAPFAQPLRVKSLLARALVIDNDMWKAGDAQGNIIPALFDTLLMRMRRVNGAIVVRDPTPFGQIFTGIDREWKMDTIVEANSYFLAEIEAKLEAFDSVDFYSAVYANIAMHGYRDVSMPEYMS